MLAKFIPATLMVLAALVTTARSPGALPVPNSVSAAHSPAKLSAPVADPKGIYAPSPIARDDYRMNLQAGVTANAYGLVPLAEHDAARTQSMIAGITGRRTTRPPTVTAADNTGQANSLLPRAETAVLWLAGLMAVVWMALRRRR